MIKIITAYDDKVYDMHRLRLQKLENYAKQHRYELITKKIPKNFDRHPYWYKILLLIDIIKESSPNDYILWLDTDTIIYNNNIKLETFIQNNKYLYISIDHNNINAGIFVVQANDIILKFFQKVWDTTEKKFTQHTWHDQDSIIQNIDNNYLNIQSYIEYIPQYIFNCYTHQINSNALFIHFAGMGHDTKISQMETISGLYIKNNILFRHNTWDESILYSIYHRNEYGLSDEILYWPGDIIDIGGHIGSFTRLLLDKNPNSDNKIWIIEPNKDNFSLLQLNLYDGISKNRVIPINACINYTTDICYEDTSSGQNTGGIVFKKESKYNIENTIGSINLDSVIDQAQSPILLKIDCEGCEFEIIQHTTKLHKIKHVVGEFHTNNPTILANYFISQNFSFTFHHTGADIGLFAANNKNV